MQPSSLALGTTDGTDFNNAISSFGGGDRITVSDVTFVAGSTPTFSAGTLSVDLVDGGTFSFGDFAFEAGTPDPLLITDHAVLDLACLSPARRS